MGNSLSQLADIRTLESAAKAAKTIWTADSLGGRFARGAVWSLVGATLSQGSSLAAAVVVARYLGRDLFGRYGMVQSTTGMIGIFAGLGLGITATKYVAELRDREPKRAGRIIALRLRRCSGFGERAGALLAGMRADSATRTLNAPELALELKISSVALFLNAVNGAQTGVLSGFEAFRVIARINLARAIVAFPATAFAVFFWHLPGAVWALGITAAVSCVLSQFLVRHLCREYGTQARPLVRVAGDGSALELFNPCLT